MGRHTDHCLELDSSPEWQGQWLCLWAKPTLLEGSLGLSSLLQAPDPSGETPSMAGSPGGSSGVMRDSSEKGVVFLSLPGVSL